MHSEVADLILRSDAIFTAARNELFSGYIVIKDGAIVAMIADGGDIRPWKGERTRFVELGERLVCPGFCDNHTFFTGYMSMRRGVDLQTASDSKHALELLQAAEHLLPPEKSLYGWGWSTSKWGGVPDNRLLDEAFPQRPVVAINDNKSYCWMNRAAVERYGFTAEDCSAEARIALLEEMLTDTAQLKKDMQAFMTRLAGQGITAIKDVCFNDSPTLMNAWHELEKEDALSLRVNIVSQPVSAPVNLTFGEQAQRRFHSPWLRFHGFKFMVDGVVSDHTGDMIYPYADRPGTHNECPVDYEAVRQQVLQADDHGFNCCMNAEGDAAIRRCIDIFAECHQRHPERKPLHSLSDLECPHPDDIPRMAELGLFAEVYAQVLLLNPSEADAYMRDRYGEAREGQFYDYAALFRAGVTVTIGTDLPLFIPSIPDAMYAACCRHFPDGSPVNGWYRDRGMTREQLLTAWTLNSARHHGMEALTGSLETGKRADIAVFDRNLLSCPNDELRASTVVLTLVDGRITHDHL